MGSENARKREWEAERELEEALDDDKLSAEERRVIEEQLRTIREKYIDMVDELYV